MGRFPGGFSRIGEKSTWPATSRLGFIGLYLILSSECFNKADHVVLNIVATFSNVLGLYHDRFII